MKAVSESLGIPLGIDGSTQTACSGAAAGSWPDAQRWALVKQIKQALVTLPDLGPVE